MNETPYVEGIPHKLQEAQNIDIKVSINGNPDSRVYFSRTGTNKKPVNVTRRHNFYTFHSFGLQCEDSGQYTLQAENGVKYSTNWTVELDLQCEYPNEKLNKNRRLGELECIYLGFQFNV